MTTFKNLANITLTVVALAPLAPVIGLMWAAKGIHILKQQKSTQEQSVVNHSWDMDTIVYCPAV